MKNSNSNSKQKVAKVKGRPMLHWVGKKPLEIVQSFPAQLEESFGIKKNPIKTPTFDALKNNWSNLLFHGDNKEILSTLLINGFRGKIDLIYIDPPFDSGANYVRNVELRGTKSKFPGEEQNIIEQTQYTDIWANDNYLQFMYERLILLRELLSEQGSIYLHCDWHKSHYLRFLMDEVFGDENFKNEIIWWYIKGASSNNTFGRKHNNVFYYTKREGAIFNKNEIVVEYNPETIARAKRGKARYNITEEELLKNGKNPGDVWDYDVLNDVNPVQGNSLENTDYPTQKPEALLERIIKASSNPDSIILDCFAGSGTTQAAAQKLGRRWIGCDLNKGSIQTVSKRLQKVIKEQEKKAKNIQTTLLDDNKKEIPFYPSFLHYRVNNYDFQETSTIIRIVFEKYGIEKLKTDTFFDGLMGEKLVKIIDFNKPFTKLDLQLVKDELDIRKDEERDILIICSGSELDIDEELIRYNKLKSYEFTNDKGEKEKRSMNKIDYRDIQKDGIMAFESAQADIEIIKKGTKANIKIKDYISPTILKRLDIDRTIFDEQIKDFKAQIDVILIDTDYNGKLFNICISDVPEKKKDFVKCEYEFEIKNVKQKIAVKIIDMMGEEILIIE